MTTPSIFQESLVYWGLALVVGLALLVILLGEAIERLQRRANPAAQGLRQIRHVVLPLLALLLALRQVLGVDGSDNAMRLVETLFWGAVVYAGLTLLSNMVQIRNADTTAWVSKLPGLFFILGRALLVLFITYYVLSSIWQIDVSNLFTAVGIGALAVSFALQETLSNLVSGFLLLIDRPFKTGDWIVIQGQWMEVIEVGWRTTKCRGTTKLGNHIIPNSVLSSQTIENYGMATRGDFYRHDEHLLFSFDDPPNTVVDVLHNVMRNVDGILQSPPNRAPQVYIRAYRDNGIEYRLRFWFDGWDWWPVLHGLRLQVYYAAKRHDLTIPYPASVQYAGIQETPATDRHAEILELLRKTPALALLADDMVETLAREAAFARYGAGERIMHQDETHTDLYIIHSGGVLLTATDADGQLHEIARLIPGEIFGETALLSDESNPVTVRATTDSELLVLDHAAVAELAHQNTRFALEMNSFIEERKRTVTTVLGAEALEHQDRVQDSWVDLIRSTS